MYRYVLHEERMKNVQRTREGRTNVPGTRLWGMTLVMPWSHPIRYQVPGTTHHAACRAGLTTNQHRPTINKSINDRTIVHRLGLDRFLAEMAEKYVPIFVFWEAFWSRLSRFYKGAHVFLHETNILRTEPRFIHGGRVFVKKPILLISAYIKTPKNEMEVPIQKALFRVSEAIFFVSETIFQNASRISRKQTMESTVFVFCFRAEVFAVEPKSHTSSFSCERAEFLEFKPNQRENVFFEVDGYFFSRRFSFFEPKRAETRTFETSAEIEKARDLSFCEPISS